MKLFNFQNINDATRDTFGFAMKATYGEVKGEGREIFKRPKTDDGTKQSARGLIRILGEGQKVSGMKDRVSREEESGGMLNVVYADGKLLKEVTLSEIRERLKKQ